MDRFDVLIVGAGHAGVAAATRLRQNGFKGSIALAGDEMHAPYERPPLSKDYLAGKIQAHDLDMRPQDYWAGQAIVLLKGLRVSDVDPEARIVICEDNTQLGYGELVWAAGGAPRSLTCDGHDLPQVHAIRNRADVDALREQLQTARDVVVIGGGFIGLEAAAVLSGLGKSVTVLEAADRVLARVAAAPVSDYFADLHRRHGVTVQTNASVDCIKAKPNGRATVCVSGRSDLTADIVIVGIGILPNVAPLTAAGAAGSNGVDVDRECRTSLPGVYAVGDCAAQHNAFTGGERVRIESIQNANDQGAALASAISFIPVPAPTVPWFWSNQYDVRLQTIGLNRGWDDAVVRGDPGTDSFSAVYLKAGRVVAIDCVNAAKDFVQGKRLVAEGAAVGHGSLSDPSIPLKTFWAS